VTHKKEPIWITRDLSKCSACRKCEIACSLAQEKRVWPEASRIRVFMPVPGVKSPHFCTQYEYCPCAKACPLKALIASDKTGAVLIKRKACAACGKCINACPGRIPHVHPTGNYAVICDLCKGDPQCVKVCQARAAERAKVEDDRGKHIKEAGWGENGTPKKETLRKLGLENVDKALEKSRSE
jgi:Fe-S-cluster-containing hydrogenase component 2